MKKVFTREDIASYKMKNNLGFAHFSLENYIFKGEPHIRLKVMPIDFESRLKTRDKRDRRKFENQSGCADYKATIKTLTAKASVGIKISRFAQVAEYANSFARAAKQSRRVVAYADLANRVKKSFGAFDKELASHPSIQYSCGVMHSLLGHIRTLDSGNIKVGRYNDQEITREKLFELLDVLDQAPVINETEIKKDALVVNPASHELKDLMDVTDEEFKFLCDNYHYNGYQMVMNGESYGNGIDSEFREEFKSYLMPKRTGMLDLI